MKSPKITPKAPKAPKAKVATAPTSTIPVTAAPPDPKASVANVITAIARIRTDADEISDALSVHILASSPLRSAVADMVLHTGLKRLQMAVGELRHGLEAAAPK